MKRNKLRNICIYYIFILSIAFTGLTISRYLTSASISYSARVAGFEVSAFPYSDNSENLEIDYKNPDKLSADYRFYVSNKKMERSETGIEYEILVRFDDSLPNFLGVELKCDGNGKITKVISEEGKLITFNSIDFIFHPDDTYTHDFVLSLRGEDYESFDNRKVNMSVFVIAKQTD